MRVHLFLLPLLLAVSLAASMIAGCGRRAGSKEMNVILVTLDTTRADHLGAYGYPLPTSPAFDSLAATGVLFERARAQASVTPVAHASIMTGLRPYHHGLRFLHGTYGFQLPEQALTLAEILRDRGYTTAAFVSAFPAGSRFGLDQGFDHFDQAFMHDQESQVVSPEGIVNTGLNQRTAAQTNQAVFAWLDAGPAEPYFLWVHYFDPHDAHLLPEDPAYRGRFAPEDSSSRARFRAIYDDEIAYMDHHLGLLLHRLSAGGRTPLVAVVADHGQGLGDHDWWSHGLLYSEDLHVPLVLAGPGIPAGRRLRSQVRQVDIAPTILSLAGVGTAPLSGGPQGKADGVDLTPLLKGTTDDLHLTSYGEATTILSYNVPYAPDSLDRKNDQLFSLTRERWKYIHHRFGLAPDELYDLVADPGETDNRIESESMVALGLRRQLLQDRIYPKESPMLGGMSAEDLKRLRSLGYIGGSQ